MRLLFAFTGGLLLLAMGCRTFGPKFDPAQMESRPEAQASFAPLSLSNRLDSALLKPPTEPYRLGPGDIIEVESIGEGAARATLTVGPDGKIYYSLLPGVSVWGLSLAESRVLLQQEMAKYVRAIPELVLNLRSVGSQKVWLLGAVRAPGVYPLSVPTTLLDALTAAGGVPSTGADDGGDFQRSFVMRNGTLIPVDFARLLKQGDLGQNIYLAPGDFVFLRPAEVPSVYLLGAVGTPAVIPYSRDLTVARAIIGAGSTVKYAQQNKVVIVRGGLTQPRVAEVNYHAIITGKEKDVLLQPGDIVYIPYTPFRFVAQMAEEVLNQFVRAVAVNEGTYVGSGSASPAGLALPLAQ